MKISKPNLNKLSIYLVIIILSLIFNASTYAQALEINGKAALLIDAQSGRIFFEKNIDDPLPVASITKIMTLTIILETVNEGLVSLNDLVSTSEYAASMGGSQVWLDVGEQLPLKELIYAIAVGSANDASVAVAEYIAGTERSFVELMNNKATELGMTNSVFSNASGLPTSIFNGGEQLISARDAGILARYALDIPMLMDFVSTYEYTMRAQTTKRPQLWNYNKLLRRYSGVDGLKTGYTSEAGYCLAATAKRDDLRLIAIVLGSSNDSKREQDIRTLLDYGFRKYKSFTVMQKDEVCGQLTFKKGEPKIINTIIKNDLKITIERAEEQQITTDIIYYDNLTLPLKAGAPVGTVKAFLNNKQVGESIIVLEEHVLRGSIFSLISRMSSTMIEALLSN